jgi:hypothetical protein
MLHPGNLVRNHPQGTPLPSKDLGEALITDGYTHRKASPGQLDLYAALVENPLKLAEMAAANQLMGKSYDETDDPAYDHAKWMWLFSYRIGDMDREETLKLIISEMNTQDILMPLIPHAKRHLCEWVETWDKELEEKAKTYTGQPRKLLAVFESGGPGRILTNERVTLSRGLAHIVYIINGEDPENQTLRNHGRSVETLTAPDTIAIILEGQSYRKGSFTDITDLSETTIETITQLAKNGMGANRAKSAAMDIHVPTPKRPENEPQSTQGTLGTPVRVTPPSVSNQPQKPSMWSPG